MCVVCWGFSLEYLVRRFGETYPRYNYSKRDGFNSFPNRQKKLFVHFGLFHNEQGTKANSKSLLSLSFLLIVKIFQGLSFVLLQFIVLCGWLVCAFLFLCLGEILRAVFAGREWMMALEWRVTGVLDFHVEWLELWSGRDILWGRWKEDGSGVFDYEIEWRTFWSLEAWFRSAGWRTIEWVKDKNGLVSSLSFKQANFH